jgi:phosphoribosylaminoimidazolecarboxamide formyltransferase/IMP cyclohydrolase
MRALISVYYKDGVEELAKALQELGYEIVSSSSTAKYLTEKGLKVKEIGQITNFPEIFGGRVKTLHPFIHGGILMRDWVEEDKRQAKELGIEPIDVVVVNLYPFEEKLREGLEERELMEFVDIGGSALIRASAKNFYRVSGGLRPCRLSLGCPKTQRKKSYLGGQKILGGKGFFFDSLLRCFNFQCPGKPVWHF